jgi:hypothetical protein
MVLKCCDCGVQPGKLHKPGCDVERCPYCGGQLISCSCEAQDRFGVPYDDRMPWTGEWPGAAECREFGWYAVPGPDNRGWVSCNPDEPGSTPDLNRLAAEAIWDREQKRWVQKETNQLSVSKTGPRKSRNSRAKKNRREGNQE